MKNWLRSNARLFISAAVVAVLLFISSGMSFKLDSVNYRIGYVRVATASGVIDQPLTQVGIQAALNALPATGGKVNIMNNAVATLNFAGTVTRAIPNVIIQSSGSALLFQNDGVTPLFSTGGQTGWVFQDVRTDAGGIAQSADTVLINVQIGSNKYALMGGGTANLTSIRTADNVTASSFTTSGAGADEFLIDAGGAFASPNLWLYQFDATTWIMTTRPGNQATNLKLQSIQMVGGSSNISFPNTYSGSGNATLGVNNSPGNGTPYTWIRVISSDGSTVYIPAWK